MTTPEFVLQPSDEILGERWVIVDGRRAGVIRPTIVRDRRLWTPWIYGPDGVARPAVTPLRPWRDRRVAALMVVRAVREGGRS